MFSAHPAPLISIHKARNDSLSMLDALILSCITLFVFLSGGNDENFHAKSAENVVSIASSLFSGSC